MARVKNGRLITVGNKDRKFGSANEYVAVWVEDSNGKDERCLLFTQREIDNAAKRAGKNIEDLTKKSWLTTVTD